jgi:hypothetical protein
MRGVFGMLLIGGGIILLYGLFTGKIFPSGYDLSGIPNNTPGLKGNPGAPPVTLPAQGHNCPQGYIYSPVTKNCQSLAGV